MGNNRWRQTSRSVAINRLRASFLLHLLQRFDRDRNAFDVVVLADGKEESHTLKVSDRDEFMKLWKQASSWLSIHWDDFDSN